MDTRLRALVITSATVEYAAVSRYVSNLRELTTSNGTIYERGTFEKNWDVTILEVDNVCDTLALEIESAIDDIQPNLTIFVGIAFGIDGVRGGDVVFVNKIYFLDDRGILKDEIVPASYYPIRQRAKSEARKKGWTQRSKSGQGIENKIQEIENKIREIENPLNPLNRLYRTPRVNLGISPEIRLPISPAIARLTQEKEPFERIKLFLSKRSVYIASILSSKSELDSSDFIASHKDIKIMESNSLIEFYRNHSSKINNVTIIRGVYNKFENSIDKDLNISQQAIAADLASAFAFELLSKLDAAIFSPKEETTNITTKSQRNKAKNLIVSNIILSNIKCFRKLEVDFKEGKNFHGWTTILGDNAVGKSTLLRSIVLGLCNEGDAVALIKEMSGDLIREGEDRGCITIHLIEDKKTRGKKYTITTTIEKTDNKTEIVRQTTDPVENFPWDDIFVCGYGAYRSQRADISYKEYKTIDAVRSLFNQQTTLQNPEIILLRQEPEIRQILEEKLKNILMLDIPEYGLQYSKRGLEIVGSWGRMPLESLSDGYRSTATWVLDFIGWLIYAERLVSNPDIGGILIVDELEQHLHPRWQRYIVSRLRQQFPKTQIIVTTHTPLVAAGIADVDRGMLLKLKRDDLLGEIVIQRIDLETIAGKPADRVLTSEAFDLLTTRNDRSHDDVDRYTQLLGKKQRTDDEEAELQRLKPIIKDRFNNGETTAAQIAEEAIDVALQKRLDDVSMETIDIEIQKQLQELFKLAD